MKTIKHIAQLSRVKGVEKASRSKSNNISVGSRNEEKKCNKSYKCKNSRLISISDSTSQILNKMNFNQKGGRIEKVGENETDFFSLSISNTLTLLGPL